jgi:hypothetical protein
VEDRIVTFPAITCEFFFVSPWTYFDTASVRHRYDVPLPISIRDACIFDPSRMFRTSRGTERANLTVRGRRDGSEMREQTP